MFTFNPTSATKACLGVRRQVRQQLFPVRFLQRLHQGWAWGFHVSLPRYAPTVQKMIIELHRPSRFFSDRDAIRNAAQWRIPCQSGQSPHLVEGPMPGPNNKIITVTVTYVGVEPFVEEVHGNPTLEHVKRAAMKKFELEQSAAAKYVLQFQGTDLDDKTHVETFGQTTLTLVLALKQEPVKG
jgi:hypothetical protein